MIGNTGDRGYSVIEMVVSLCVAVTVMIIAVPSTIVARDEGRVRQASAFVAARLRDAKQQAVTRGAVVALVFDRDSGRWTYQLCVDGNANGVRRAEIRSGRDRCPEAPVDLDILFPGTSLAADATIRGPDDDPASGDAVRFGSSDIASFSPTGSATAGTLFVRSSRGTQYAVRVAGTTGRLRVLRYDPATKRWREQ